VTAGQHVSSDKRKYVNRTTGAKHNHNKPSQQYVSCQKST